MTSGGYYAEMPDGKCIRSTAIIVPKWKPQSCQALHAEQPQKLNPEAPIGDSLGLENPDEVLGLSEPGAGPGFADHVEFEEVNAEQDIDPDLSDLVEVDQPLEIVHEVEIAVEESPPGKPVTVIPPRRRLHQKTTPLLPGVNATPTLRRIARTVGGESVANELDDMEKWMLFQHRNMVQLARELAMDVSGGSQCDSGTLQQVKREVQEIEVHLKKISGDDETAVKEEVLQTRTVSIQEVRQDMSAWVQPFQEEYETLCRTVVGPMTPEMTKDVIAKAKHVERIPSEIVPTIKPPHKKRGRIVACGNYASVPDGEISAGETICLRTLMRKSAHMGWSISTIDIKKAFLNAPRVEKEGHVTIIEPPAVLVAMGVVPSSESWRVRGAIYGLIQSPHDWGLHRDSTFREATWTCDGEMLKLVETPERHLWRIVTVNQGEERGYLCSYVDDLMITGNKSVVDSTIKLIESCWECSSPEYVNEITNTRFCGYELRWDGDSLLLTQPSYTMDLVGKYKVTGKEREPSPKITPGEDEAYDAETLRRAQQITGELLWVQTRTRPDLSYAVGAMSWWLHKRPQYVMELGEHALKYLAGTIDYAVKYGKCDGQEWDPDSGCHTPASMHQAEVFVDSSFSLEHEQFRSITGVLISHGGAPISWTSGRQAFISFVIGH